MLSALLPVTFETLGQLQPNLSETLTVEKISGYVEDRDPFNVPTEGKATVGISVLLDSKNPHGQRMLQT